MKYKEATPEEIKEWHETDYWMKMDFDPLVLFAVVPSIIQITVLGFMAAAIGLIHIFS